MWYNDSWNVSSKHTEQELESDNLRRIADARTENHALSISICIDTVVALLLIQRRANSNIWANVPVMHHPREVANENYFISTGHVASHRILLSPDSSSRSTWLSERAVFYTAACGKSSRVIPVVWPVIVGKLERAAVRRSKIARV